MAAWRIIAAAILGIAGTGVILIAMARARERTGKAGTTAMVGSVGLATLVVLVVLALTVLGAIPTWIVVAVATTTVTVLVLAS